jgi:hypothetical protein
MEEVTNKKPKILLLSDDLRMHSGVSTMSRELVFGTLDTYDWVHIGGAIKHPEAGAILDLSESISKELNLNRESTFLKLKDQNLMLV